MIKYVACALSLKQNLLSFGAVTVKNKVEVKMNDIAIKLKIGEIWGPKIKTLAGKDLRQMSTMRGKLSYLNICVNTEYIICIHKALSIKQEQTYGACPHYVLKTLLLAHLLFRSVQRKSAVVNY